MAYINEIHSMLSIFVVLVYKHLHLKIIFFPENTHFTKPSRCPINSNTSEEHVCYDDSQNCRKCNHYHAQTEVSSCNRQKRCLVVVLCFFIFIDAVKFVLKCSIFFFFLILNFYIPINGTLSAAFGVDSASSNRRTKNATKTFIPVKGKYV